MVSDLAGMTPAKMACLSCGKASGMGRFDLIWRFGGMRAVSFFGRLFFVLFFGMPTLGAADAVLPEDLKNGIAHYDSGRYQEAFVLIKGAAEKGNAEAAYRLSSLYRDGKGVDADREQAFLWCRRAAFQDHVGAAYLLSSIYREKGIEQDDRQAYYWFRRAAELDMENGRLMMALMYYRGDLAERNVEKALTWLHRAAMDGNVTALLLLGKMYESGENVKQDHARAVTLFEAAARKNVEGLVSRETAQKDRSEAQYRLGRMAEEGRGMPADREVALEWYKKAAADGNEAASARLDKEIAASVSP